MSGEKGRSQAADPRPRPCASCPYRCDVPSGVWEQEEYDKLPRYDGDVMGQSPAVFMCHQSDGHVCSGWLGHRDHPAELLAVRLGGMAGRLSEACLDYATDVPLFGSGAEARAHGLAEITAPSRAARTTQAKIERARAVRGRPSDAASSRAGAGWWYGG